MSTPQVTLINKRDGKERYTRHEMSDVVEMIRTGKLKSGKLIDELSERPLVCFSSKLMTKGTYQWADVYNGCVLLEINSLPDRQTAEEIRDEARFIPYTVIAFVGADGRSVKIVSQAAERDMWQNPDGYELKDVEQFHRNAYAKYHYIYSRQRLPYRPSSIPPSDCRGLPGLATMGKRTRAGQFLALQPRHRAAMSIRPARPMPLRLADSTRRRISWPIVWRFWRSIAMRAASRRPLPSG